MSESINTIIDNISKSISDNKKITALDITVCLAIRASEINPWVLDRLSTLLGYFNPKPNFLVVDFGSEGGFSDQIENICNDGGARYFFVDDTGTFSLSKARNIAALNSTTDFLFFTDVDFIYNYRIFGQLAELIDDLEISSAIRRFLPMPIYHINKAASEEFDVLETIDEKNKFIMQLGYMGHGTKFKDIFEFVAPYSNAFLIHREFFNLSGGYCDEFRGHGSEDFDFLIRLGILAMNIPLPSALEKDFYGPLKSSFFSDSSYIGFRRFLELCTAPSESLGLKAFHLWHESPRGQGYWTAENDWKRNRFNQALSKYYPEVSNIINVDYLPRENDALCLFTDKSSWGYFLPLRSLGYKLTAVNNLNDDILYELLTTVSEGKYQRIFIFNPYMKSHAKFFSILEVAKKSGVKITVIERGGLPNSIYYADEVVYGDPIYRQLDNILSDYNLKNKSVTSGIISRIKTGNDVLESQDSYEDTKKRNLLLSFIDKTKFFIPLQLSDDMAVTKFTENNISYSEFYNEILEVAKNNPDDIFVIKQHPLSKNKISNNGIENLIVANDRDNIHYLIDICSATIVYNSGVGLLSCIHQKPTYNIGNAYYSSKNLSQKVKSLADAVACYKDKSHEISDLSITKFVDWLVYEKYSWFSADTVLREFKDRKAHGYQNIVVEILNLDNTRKNCGNRNQSYPFSEKSYLAWKGKLGLNKQLLEKKKESKAAANKKDIRKEQCKGFVDKQEAQKLIFTPDSFFKTCLTSVLTLFLNERKTEKLKSNTESFFDDSNSRFIKFLRRFYLN